MTATAASLAAAGGEGEGRSSVKKSSSYGKHNPTKLEQTVREMDDFEPSDRLILHTVDPETEDAGESRFTVTWKSTAISQMLLRFKEALPDGDDLERNIYIGVPDIEGDALLALCMYLEAYSVEASDAIAAAELAGEVKKNNNNNENESKKKKKKKPSANPEDEEGEGEEEEPAVVESLAFASTERRVAAQQRHMKQKAAAASAGDNEDDEGEGDDEDEDSTNSSNLAATAKTGGATQLERPYKPQQMELPMKTVVQQEPLLTGYEKWLAEKICSASEKDAVRMCRGLLCAGWFLQMNTSFLDLVGWCLSLRFRGHDVHQIKSMMSMENVKVRKEFL